MSVEPSRRPPKAPLAGPEPPLDLGDTGRDLYAATEPIAFGDREHGWAWARFLAALAAILDPISEMVRADAEGNDGWTALASPRRCPEPWLRVLAQWAGFRRWDALSAADLRELLGGGHAPGMWRGTRGAMLDAVRRFLPEGAGDALYFEERADGDAYKLRVFTYAWAEVDERAVFDALWMAKPAGIFPVEYQVREGQAYFQARARVANYAEGRELWASYEAARTYRPGGM
jgi:hypothetical protein